MSLVPLRRFTPARIALGRAGSGLPTEAHLQFSLDHAMARDAVHAALDFAALAAALERRGWRSLQVASAAADRDQYLRRPDFGRRLSPSSRAALATAPACDVVLVAADGLSAAAVAAHLLPLLDVLMPRLAGVGPVVLAAQGRVALGDEIGELLRARLAILLIGERPGLSSPDSLGCYVTFQPRVGTMDSARHCISNIRAQGLAIPDAAEAIARLAADALALRATGLELERRRAPALLA